MTDDYKKGLVTGLAMQPLAVVDTTQRVETAENLKSSDTDCRIYTHSNGFAIQSPNEEHLGALYLGYGLEFICKTGYPAVKIQSGAAQIDIYGNYIKIQSGAATIYADGNGFTIYNGKQRLEAKKDIRDDTQSLFFNGKKVLTE